MKKTLQKATHFAGNAVIITAVTVTGGTALGAMFALATTNPADVSAMPWSDTTKQIFLGAQNAMGVAGMVLLSFPIMAVGYMTYDSTQRRIKNLCTNLALRKLAKSDAPEDQLLLENAQAIFARPEKPKIIADRHPEDELFNVMLSSGCKERLITEHYGDQADQQIADAKTYILGRLRPHPSLATSKAVHESSLMLLIRQDPALLAKADKLAKSLVSMENTYYGDMGESDDKRGPRYLYGQLTSFSATQEEHIAREKRAYRSDVRFRLVVKRQRVPELIAA